MVPVEMQKIIALHNHIVKLDKRKAALQPGFETLISEHLVDRKMDAHIPQQLNVVEFKQPVPIAKHQRAAIREIKEPLHLPFETLGIMVDLLNGEHLTHIGLAGGIAYHRCSGAQQRNRKMSCPL